MGIRFFCPNGHKLNVKEFQAGMRGVCPHCSAKFIIPTQSTRPSSKEETHQAEPAVSGVGAFNTPVASREGSLPSVNSSQAAPLAMPMVAAPGAMDPLGTPLGSVMPEDSYAVGATGSTSAQDPIAESGNALWYVQPPTGGQFGPVLGEVLRTWLAEGRISPDTLVWRQGWPDWREAKMLFPELRQMASVSPSVPQFIAPAIPAPAVAATVKRKTAWSNQKKLVIGLAVLVTVLILIFFVILSRS